MTAPNLLGRYCAVLGTNCYAPCNEGLGEAILPAIRQHLFAEPECFGNSKAYFLANE